MSTDSLSIMSPLQPPLDSASIALYYRATNYLAAAQIYLKDNVLLDQPLQPDHIKDRLLGHWGTSPGINFMYAHLNQLILRHAVNMLLVTGPGHGAPANLANLYLEGTLTEYYPELTRDRAGLTKFIRSFSAPNGFPSHLYPGIPGTIHEGGELGYALATSFGAVMDNPDLIVACIVGDGEAETGPTATAWHSTKFLDPAESGAVLPILHLNGYKITSASIYATMTDAALTHLFTGYGYQVRFVAGDALDAQMAEAVEWAFSSIQRIQQAARAGQRIPTPPWPLIILRSLKGWTGVKTWHGKLIEGSYRSHQVPVPDAKTNQDSLRVVEEWLRSYHPEELFDGDGCPHPTILAQCPQGDRRMGCNPHTFGGRMRQQLICPSIHDYAVTLEQNADSTCQRGISTVSSLEQVGLYLRDIIAHNPHSFRIVSPDELESNKLSAVFATTHRDYQWPVNPDDESIGPENGRVLEMLSEHTCQAWLQGYLLTGRYGLFPSYEAFLGIITSMMDQYAKFLKLSQEIPWRLPVPSLNYLETSTLWRQEHNGFSHQSPGFINSVLNKKAKVSRVYLPPDSNCLVSTIDHCLQSTDYVNLVIANKPKMPQWLTMAEAIEHCRMGASIWQWASTTAGVDPDVVLVGIGDVPTLEVMAAADLLRTDLPELRVRVVNVTDLLILEKHAGHPHGLSDDAFTGLFTDARPVIINFHGYPSAIKELLFDRHMAQRFTIYGYREEGTTTTPFDMAVRNGISRYHVAMAAMHQASERHPQRAIHIAALIARYQSVLVEHRHYIAAHGVDMPAIAQWQWQQ